MAEIDVRTKEFDISDLLTRLGISTTRNKIAEIKYDKVTGILTVTWETSRR